MLQNEDFKPELQFEPSQSKPKQGWKETTLFSVHRGDGKPPVTKVFTKSGEGRHPMLSTTFTNQDPGRSKLTSSQLERLHADLPNTQQRAPGDKNAWPTGKLHYLNYIRPPSGGRSESQLDFGSKTQRPNLDKLLFKANSNQLTPKAPLSVTDGIFFSFPSCGYFSIFQI